MTGRERLEITIRYKGQVIWHMAGPGNIVRGLHRKWLKNHPEIIEKIGEKKDDEQKDPATR